MTSNNKFDSTIDLGFHHLAVHNIDFDLWCEKYRLRAFTAPCMDCDKPLFTGTPISGKNLRGLRTEPCGCGNHDVPFTFVDLNYSSINLTALGSTGGNSTSKDDE